MQKIISFLREARMYIRGRVAYAWWKRTNWHIPKDALAKSLNLDGFIMSVISGEKRAAYIERQYERRGSVEIRAAQKAHAERLERIGQMKIIERYPDA